jgi:hypothetical protein
MSSPMRTLAVTLTYGAVRLMVDRKHWIYTVADFVDARKDRLLANGIDV